MPHRGTLLLDQSVAHNRSSINICATDEWPQGWSYWVWTFPLKIWWQAISSCSWTFLMHLWFFCILSLEGKTLPSNSCSHSFSVIPFRVTCPTLPANIDWLDDSLGMLVTHNLCVKHSQGCTMLMCFFQIIHCDSLLIRGAENFLRESKH